MPQYARSEMRPPTCWSCEEDTDSTVDITFTSPTGRQGTVELCQTCYTTIYLPLVASSPEPQGVDGVGRVLVVDDDSSIRLALGWALEDAGFAVDTAPDGAAALEKVKVQPFDAVVLDLRMPTMDGPAFLEAWRQGSSERRVPIVAMSAHEHAVRAADLGVQAFFTKPFQLDAFVGILSLLVGTAHTDRDAGPPHYL